MTDSVAFILAAGFGTRMGELGESYPKVLWPVFDKTILELQISFIEDLGIKKIFINTHHKSNIIEKFILDKELNIEVLFERDLLDSGGCIHNLKSKTDAKSALVVNGDQFFFSKSLQNWTNQKLNTLFGLEVFGEYNKLIVDSNRLVDIDKNPKDQSYYTFSGVSLVDLKKIDYLKGPSKFFESVMNFKEKEIHVCLEESIYYDFGTIQRFIDSHKRVLKKIKEGKRDIFIDFLIKHKALDLNKCNEQSYNSDIFGQLNLANGFYIENDLVKKV